MTKETFQSVAILRKIIESLVAYNGKVNEDSFTNQSIFSDCSLGLRREISYIPLSILERRSRSWERQQLKRSTEVVWVVLYDFTNNS